MADIVRMFDIKTYQRLGSPNIGRVMFVKDKNNKVYGKIVRVNDKALAGHVEITLQTFKMRKRKRDGNFNHKTKYNANEFNR